jgi:hypothetical protein
MGSASSLSGWLHPSRIAGNPEEQTTPTKAEEEGSINLLAVSQDWRMPNERLAKR